MSESAVWMNVKEAGNLAAGDGKEPELKFGRCSLLSSPCRIHRARLFSEQEAPEGGEMKGSLEDVKSQEGTEVKLPLTSG